MCGRVCRHCCLDSASVLNIEWYAEVLARIRINSFRIELAGNTYEDLLALAAASVESEAVVGNAVYMLSSFYNHDCDPNAHIVWVENVEARLKALREIEADQSYLILDQSYRKGKEPEVLLMIPGSIVLQTRTKNLTRQY